MKQRNGMLNLQIILRLKEKQRLYMEMLMLK